MNPNEFADRMSDAAMGSSRGAELVCCVCGHRGNEAVLGHVRGNTRRFMDRTFILWKCPDCHSIHSIEPVDFRDIYFDYPLNQRSEEHTSELQSR